MFVFVVTVREKNKNNHLRTGRERDVWNPYSVERKPKGEKGFKEDLGLPTYVLKTNLYIKRLVYFGGEAYRIISKAFNCY